MVKNSLIVGLAFLVAALAFGFEPVLRAINEATNRGTLAGVEKCMDYSKTSLISQNALRATCVHQFHVDLYLPEMATGKAGPRVEEETLNWSGMLENKTPDHVTTWIRISVEIFDGEGEKKEVTAETQLWIDPMGKAEFQVELPDLKPDQVERVEYCSLEEIAPKSCMRWGITDLKGLATSN